MRDFKHRIRGKWWRIKFRKPPCKDDVGLCDYDERTIYIHPDCDISAVMVHEITHASLPDIEETAVQETEDAIIFALRKVGFLDARSNT
jgi:hypothetical protein